MTSIVQFCYILVFEQLFVKVCLSARLHMDICVSFAFPDKESILGMFPDNGNGTIPVKLTRIRDKRDRIIRVKLIAFWDIEQNKTGSS